MGVVRKREHTTNIGNSRHTSCSPPSQQVQHIMYYGYHFNFYVDPDRHQRYVNATVAHAVTHVWYLICRGLAMSAPENPLDYRQRPD